MRLALVALLAAALAATPRIAQAAESAQAIQTAPEAAPTPERSRERPRLVAELGAGPMIGLDSPIRGAEAGFLLGLGWGPVEAGLRAGAALDRALECASVRLDLELGLGGGLRVLVGGVVPLARPVLEPDGAALPLEASGWPCRFGLAATIAELPAGPFGSRVVARAELAYSAYRVAGDAASSAKAALSGAAAFAACVEICATVSLAWGARAH